MDLEDIRKQQTGEMMDEIMRLKKERDEALAKLAAMKILNTCMSDYDLIEEADWSVVEAVLQTGGWYMRSHPTMSEDNKSRARQYLHLQGC